MATWTTDISGTGLAHTRPPGKRDLRIQRVTAERWEEWLPLVTYELRQRQMDVGHEVARLHRVHSVRMGLMLRVGVALRTIYRDRERRLDDPRLPDAEWQEMFARVERNVKGRKRAEHRLDYPEDMER